MPQMHGRTGGTVPVETDRAAPELIVVGTGRSGTASVAAALRGVHEPNMIPVVYLAAARSHGWLSDRDIAVILEGETGDWPKVVSDYKQSELIDITSRMWPDCKYLWVTRNPADSVASMAAKGWYRQSDDAYPPGYLVWYQKLEDGLSKSFATNDAGNRTRGDQTGDYTRDEWLGMGQVERCGWWWNYCNRVIAGQLSRLEADRWMRVRLEDADSWPFDVDMPVVNTSTSKPVSGWESYTKELADALGY